MNRRAFKLVLPLLGVLAAAAVVALTTRFLPLQLLHAQAPQSVTQSIPSPTSPADEVLSSSPSPASRDTHPILGDLRVRQGIAYCTNKAGLIRSVYPWLEDPQPFEMDSILPRGHWAYPQSAPNFLRYPYDPEKGKALFEEAGWRLAPGAIYRTNDAGQEMQLALTTTDAIFRQTWTAVFEDQMKACGLRVRRIHLPAEQFYGADGAGGELGRGNYELTAYPMFAQAYPHWSDLFACGRIPSPENDWRGQNYLRWCNPKVDQAVYRSNSSLLKEIKRDAYQLIQEEVARELPGMPLFTRIDVYATHLALENFEPDSSENLYTWNAEQWVIPGRDTIVIGERSEPAGLYPWDDSFVNMLIGSLVNGLDFTSRFYDYQPVMLRQIPALENGGARMNPVQVEQGASVVDVYGRTVELQPGTRLMDAEGNRLVYTSGAVTMPQLFVLFEYVDGLTWSDGQPVTQDDYELAYHVFCNPETYGEEGYLPGELVPSICNYIDSVNFISDTAYEVTWKPGFLQDCNGYCPYLPPFGRLPAHLILGDGRRLGDVPAKEWKTLDEVYSGLPGVGPYRISRWKFGEELVLTANPHYYLGSPATPTIVVRFIPEMETANRLVRGEIDVLGPDSLRLEQVETLLSAQRSSKVRVDFLPSSYFEWLGFAQFAH